jgi:Amt family ammonium transporter
VVATNAMRASVAGALAACLYVWNRFGKPDVTMMGEWHAGGYGGRDRALHVRASSAVLIGAVAGVLMAIAAHEKMNWRASTSRNGTRRVLCRSRCDSA